MPVPDTSPTAVELWESLGAWYRRDLADERYQLLQLSEGVVGGLQLMEDVIRDEDEGPGWSKVMDADRAPVIWLPWLAQFAGTRIPSTVTTELAQRDYVKGTPGFLRGSPGAMVAEAQATLTGAKIVYLRERDTSAYHLTVNTLISETPDPDATLRALLSQKPAGIVLEHNTIVGQDYQQLKDSHTDYADVDADYADYDELRSDI